MICEASEDATPEVELCEEREDLDETLATFGLLLPNEEAHIPLSHLWEVYSTSPTIALRKFAKNRTLRSMSHVCRTWRACLIHAKYLWRDIAFDVNEPKSIRLAKDFLDAVRGSTIPLHIYLGLGKSVDPKVSTLLQDLRTYTDRWEIFEYQGELKNYRQYLDLEAQRLLHFSDRHDFSSVLLPPRRFSPGKHQRFVPYPPPRSATGPYPRYQMLWSSTSHIAIRAQPSHSNHSLMSSEAPQTYRLYDWHPPSL